MCSCNHNSFSRLQRYCLNERDYKSNEKGLTPFPSGSHLRILKREQIRSNYVNHLLRTCAYSSHQVSSRSLHSQRFPRFLFPSSNPLCPRIQFESKMEHLRHKILLYISSFIKIRSPIRKIKIPQFSHFARIPVSLPTPSMSQDLVGI